MEHSLESYLMRQKTETLERLLQLYEEELTAVDRYVAQMIRSILEKRKEDA